MGLDEHSRDLRTARLKEGGEKKTEVDHFENRPPYSIPARLSTLHGGGTWRNLPSPGASPRASSGPPHGTLG